MRPVPMIRSGLLVAVVLAGAVAASAGSCQTTAGSAGTPDSQLEQDTYLQGGDSVPGRSRPATPGPGQEAAPGPLGVVPGDENQLAPEEPFILPPDPPSVPPQERSNPGR